MRESRIILVEGMPGTGKSTLAQFIHLQLRAHGHRSCWYHEERSAHPVRLFYDPERHLSWSDYCEEAAARWQAFARELQRQKMVAVLDAAVLQNHVRSLLLFDRDRTRILDLVSTIEGLLGSLSPVWISLKPEDIEANFRRIVKLRGQRLLGLWLEAQERFPYASGARASGYAGFIAFWEEFDAISDQIFDRLTIAKYRQTVSRAEWCGRSDAILEFVDLPRPDEPRLALDLSRFTGSYVSRDDPAKPGFFIHAREGCLIMSCDAPTMDVHRGPVGCYREVRLIPSGNNRFYVETWPHDVEFTEDPAEMSASMRVSVIEEGWPQSNEVYIRRVPVTRALPPG